MSSLSKMLSGFCIDLETTIAGRIPDSVRPAGKKRYETRIIEIGAVHWKNTTRQLKCLVNPIPKSCQLTTPNDLLDLLRSLHQKPDATIDFWSKVLVKRKSVTSQMFLHDEPPSVWNRRTILNKAADFVRWHNNPTLGPTFITETQALTQLLAFTACEPVWLAHNGRSFDFKVLEGCAERSNIQIPTTLKQVDTLKLFRQRLPGHKSYSQPILYQNIFKRGYNAHVAIDDAIALSELCDYVNSQPEQRNVRLTPTQVPTPTPTGKWTDNTVWKCENRKLPMNLTFMTKVVQSPELRLLASPKQVVASPKQVVASTPPFVDGSKRRLSLHQGVRSLRGVGPKTESALSKLNINTISDLKVKMEESGVAWLRRAMPTGTRWRVVAQSVSSLMITNPILTRV